MPARVAGFWRAGLSVWSTNLSKSDEVVIEYDEGCHPEKHPDHHEEGVEVPMESINADTLRNLIAEFVTREWEEAGDAHFTLNHKINQVLRQLQEKKAKVVFDLTTNSCNIVTSEGKVNS